jgi:hypothetical protein
VKFPQLRPGQIVQARSLNLKIADNKACLTLRGSLNIEPGVQRNTLNLSDWVVGQQQQQSTFHSEMTDLQYFDLTSWP